MLSAFIKLSIYGVLSVFLIACNSTDEEPSTGPLLTETSSAEVADCPSGGSTVVFGYDNNDDDAIDEVIDSTTICNGGTAQELIVEQDYDSSCNTGGSSLTFGYDNTDDGSIDTIVDTIIICSLNTALDVIVGSNILYYDVAELDDPTDKYLEVLTELNDRRIITLTTTTGNDFIDNITNGDFDVVIYTHRGSSDSDENKAALSDWVDSGKRAIFSSWDPDSILNGVFDSNNVGSNQTKATFTDDIVGLYLDTVPVENRDERWGSYSSQLEPTGTAYSVCSWENDTSCAIVGNNGKTVNIGIFSDSLTLEEARKLVPNLIRQVSQ